MWKEELIATYYESTDSKLDVQNASLIVEDLKKQITELQQEKDVLLAQLSSSSSVSSKLEKKLI